MIYLPPQPNMKAIFFCLVGFVIFLLWLAYDIGWHQGWSERHMIEVETSRLHRESDERARQRQ